MIFKFIGLDVNGNVVKDKIEAVSLEQAKSKLKSKNIIYESIDEETPSIISNIEFGGRYKIPSKDLASLSRELAMYIRSGINIVSALKIAQTHYESNKKIKLFLATVSTHLDEGKTFYAALDTQTIVELPEFFKQSIKVSENSGILDEVLIELYRFLKEQDKITKEIKRAFTYPSFMVFVSLIMISFMLAFVVPQITDIFVSMNQELPAPTKVVIAVGDFFNENFITILAFLSMSVILFMFLMRNSHTFAYSVNRMILKLPFFGRIVEKSELARFSYIASLLTRSGVPFVQTVNLSAGILDNLVMRKLFEDASKKVVEGKLLSSALNESNVKIDNTFIQSIVLGEETSQVENVLINISELYFEENRDRISTLLTLLEPVLMLFVGGSIGFIVAAMLLPIFSMSIG
ncbi:MAG: type II secretion system F family protein [Campylobacterota bacterium]